MRQLTLSTVGSELNSLLPDFTAYSTSFQEYLADPVDHSLYGVFADFASMLKILMDVDNRAELSRYFAFLNKIIESPDEYIEQVVYDCIIESLAHTNQYYYTESKKYLNPTGVKLLNWCKNNPPLGVAIPAW